MDAKLFQNLSKKMRHSFGPMFYGVSELVSKSNKNLKKRTPTEKSLAKFLQKLFHADYYNLNTLHHFWYLSIGPKVL